MAVSAGQNSTYCLEGSDILPVQLYRHGTGCSMYKALKKHSALQSRTPAQASLIEVDGKNRWKLSFRTSHFTGKIQSKLSLDNPTEPKVQY